MAKLAAPEVNLNLQTEMHDLLLACFLKYVQAGVICNCINRVLYPFFTVWSGIICYHTNNICDFHDRSPQLYISNDKAPQHSALWRKTQHLRYLVFCFLDARARNHPRDYYKQVVIHYEKSLLRRNTWVSGPRQLFESIYTFQDLFLDRQGNQACPT